MTSKLNIVYYEYKKKQKESEQLLRKFFKDRKDINAEKESFFYLHNQLRQDMSELKLKQQQTYKKKEKKLGQLLRDITEKKSYFDPQNKFGKHRLELKFKEKQQTQETIQASKEIRQQIEEMETVLRVLGEAFVYQEIYKKELKDKIAKSWTLNKICYKNTFNMVKCSSQHIKLTLEEIKYLPQSVSDIALQNSKQNSKYGFTITIDAPKLSWIDKLLNFFDKILCCSSHIDDSLPYPVQVEVIRKKFTGSELYLAVTDSVDV